MTDQRVAFICDRKKCKNCNPDCLHTTDINHAANFERTLAPDTWFESKPTVDAEPVKHGKWFELATYDGCEVDYRCSNCGATVSGFVQDYKYCPYCSARMDEERKEE